MERVILYDETRFALETALFRPLEKYHTNRLRICAMFRNSFTVTRNASEDTIVYTKKTDGVSDMQVYKENKRTDVIDDILECCKNVTIINITETISKIMIRECFTTKDVSNFFSSVSGEYPSIRIRADHGDEIKSYAEIMKHGTSFRFIFETYVDRDDNVEIDPIINIHKNLRSLKSCLELVRKTLATVRPWNTILLTVKQANEEIVLDIDKLETLNHMRNTPKTGLHMELMHVVYDPQNISLVVDEHEFADMKKRWVIST